MSEITPDVLDQWKAQWSSTAKRIDDRMGRNTAGRHLEKVKAFARYCQRMGWTKMNSAYEIRAMKVEDSETLPLLGGRYEQVLQTTFDYDKAMRPDDRYGAELRALFELMRWSGLRISDALALEKTCLIGNRLTLRLVKSQGKRKLTLVLPDHVIAALGSLPLRKTVHHKHYFWSGASKIKSFTGLYRRKITRLNQFLNIVDRGRGCRVTGPRTHDKDGWRVRHLR